MAGCNQCQDMMDWHGVRGCLACRWEGGDLHVSLELAVFIHICHLSFIMHLRSSELEWRGMTQHMWEGVICLTQIGSMLLSDSLVFHGYNSGLNIYRCCSDSFVCSVILPWILYDHHSIWQY